MKKSELRQIIREEIQKEMFGLQDYGRGETMTISRFELEKNRHISDNPNNYYVIKDIAGNWPSSINLELANKKVMLQRIKVDDKSAIYKDPMTNFNPVTITIHKK